MNEASHQQHNRPMGYTGKWMDVNTEEENDSTKIEIAGVK